jgi:hypothetical protein
MAAVEIGGRDGVVFQRIVREKFSVTLPHTGAPRIFYFLPHGFRPSKTIGAALLGCRLIAAPCGQCVVEIGKRLARAIDRTGDE